MKYFIGKMNSFGKQSVYMYIVFFRNKSMKFCIYVNLIFYWEKKLRGVGFFCQEWQQLERDLLIVEILVVVYFVYEDKKLIEIYKDIEIVVISDYVGFVFEGIGYMFFV